MKRLSDRLTIFFLGYLYAFVMLFLLASIIYEDTPVLLIILVSFASYLGMTLILSSKITRGIFYGLAGLTGIGIGVLYFIKKAGFINEQVTGIISLWEKIYYNELLYSTETMRFAPVFIVAAAFLLSIVVFVFFNKFFRFFIITALTIAIQLFSWIMSGKENRLAFAIICTLTIVSYIRHVYEKKMKSNLASDKVTGSLMLFSIPAAIIPVIAVMLIPKNDLPIQWPWLDQKIMKAIEYVEQRFSYSNVEFFSLSTTGFNGRSDRLGGPVRPSNTIVMDVKATKRTYLRGAAYNWYENNSWSQIKNDKLNVISIHENEKELEETRQGMLYVPFEDMFPNLEEDDIELLRGLNEGRFNTLLFPTYSLSVHYRNMTTRSMFTPLKTIMPVKDDSGNPMPINENLHGIIISALRLPGGTVYTLDYAQPMYGEPMLKKALTFSRTNLYKDALTELYKKRNIIVQNFPPTTEIKNGDSLSGDINISDDQMDALTSSMARVEGENVALNSIDRKIDVLNKLYARAKEIEYEYTKVSDSIPERVQQLALEITKDCKTDYEKVIKIEAYLRENYDYTLNASRVPEGRDFVDWFLFEDKKGYCSYYATAMAVLLRYNGIPSRYVEGYVLPEEPNENDVYTVSNRNAHAWVEVYFEGFGWLTFEPTTVYADVMNYRASVQAANIPVGSDMIDIEELMKRYAGDTDIPGYTPPVQPKTTEIDYGKYLNYLLMGLAALVLIMFLVNLMAGLIQSLILARLKNKNRFIRYYQMLLKWLENAGYAIKVGETVLEFSKRIEKIYAFEPYSFETITRVFSKVRYGDYDVTTEEIKMLTTVAKKLKRYVLKEIGLKRFMPLRRIILGI